MSLWRTLEIAMRSNGDRPALTRPDGFLMLYSELLEHVHKKAEKLGTLIPSGSKVAVMDQHPFHEALSVLAFIKLGITIIPLALKYGEQRTIQIIHHTKPDYLYTGEASLISKPLIEACMSAGTTLIADQTVCLDADQWRSDSRNNREAAGLPPSLIMYTSGSTGLPKGAVLTYENIAANIRDIQTYLEVGDDDHLLIHRSLSHASVMTGELLYGLIEGARLTFYTDAFVPRRMLAFMELHGITQFGTTPTVMYQLALDKSDYRLPHLRQVALMGEYLHHQVACKIKDKWPHVTFFMMYGQTEAAPRITYLPACHFAEKDGCIGIPLPSLDIRIVDEQGADRQQGQVGELLVKGPNIFHGYWAQPELTASKLREGWLHTGDMVCEGEDGYLYMAGRKDDMIIRAGMNIYPIEIEEVLLKDSRIREAVAFGIPDPKYGHKLHVSIVPEIEDDLRPIDVLELCKKHLAPYQVPDVVQIVKEIVRNESGKTIRKQVVSVN
ncbi:class I adenylate-forming enzyme family protein [Paenibacillus sp. SI8]|uniref:class I adenylate-forming enzyme family protein n=1 Tax=unclassified Paenibacillus TaxID=185978 RepID=UPI003465FB16